MDLNINSPAYYTNMFGVDDEMYWLCRELSLYVKDKKYSDVIDVIGVVPIIAPQEELDKGLWKEVRKCEPKYGFATVSLQIDYDTYIEGDIPKKKALLIENVLKSVKAIARKAKVNYSLFENDVKKFCKEHGI